MVWLQRQRNFLDLALSSLMRRKGRNFSIIMIYSFSVFLCSSVLFLAEALLREAKEVLSEAPDMVVQNMVGGRHEPVPIGFIETVRAIRGVRDVQPRLWGYYYHPASKVNYTLIVPPDMPVEADWIEIGGGVRRTWVGEEEGRFFFKASDGQSLSLLVKGILPSASELVSSDIIVVGEKAFRRISGIRGGYVTDLKITLGNKSESYVIAEKISLAIPSARPIAREEILRSYDAVFDWRAGVALVTMVGALAAFLVLAWDRASGLTSEERVEIGVLKAVGWDASDVLCMKIWEGAVISISSYIIGVISGYLHVYLASGGLFEGALKGWAVLYPQFRLTPSLDAVQLAAVAMLTVAPYLLVTVIPAWKAAVTDPDTVMRMG